MDVTARWRELVERPDEHVPLDEAALVIAAHARPGLDVRTQLSRLDAIADRVAAASTEALCHELFGELGLRGDRRTYDDPKNSYLDQVLDRRVGIPISLSLLLVEVGRRCGLALEGVGMPGHFLVRDPAAPETLIDAFAGGQLVDRGACERLLRSSAGSDAVLVPSMLVTVGRRATLARMLANLDRSFRRRQDLRSLAWVTKLLVLMPGIAPGPRRELAGRLEELGRFADAADVLEGLADGPGLTTEASNDLLARSRALRARLN